MFAKIARELAKTVVVVMALVGVLAVVVVWSVVSRLSGGGDKVVKQGPVADAVVSAVVTESPAVVIGQQGVDVCSCGSGVQCTGSRGGKFCVDESGNKRYK